MDGTEDFKTPKTFNMKHMENIEREVRILEFLKKFFQCNYMYLTRTTQGQSQNSFKTKDYWSSCICHLHPRKFAPTHSANIA